jgi:hypothetical protein
MSFSMSEADWDAVVDVHLKGHFLGRSDGSIPPFFFPSPG